VNKIKIGTKLITAFSCIIVLTAILGIYSLWELKTLNENGNIIYEKTTIPMGILVRVTALEQDMRLQVREWKIGKTDAEREAAIKILDADNVVLKKLITEHKDRSIREEIKNLLDNLIAVTDRYVMESHNYINTNTVRMACGMTEADIPQTLIEIGKELRKTVANIIEIETAIANEISEKNSQIAKRAIKVTLVIFVLAGIVSISLSIRLTLYIAKALKTVVNAVSKIENGDMTVRSEFKYEDEFGMLSKSVDSLAFKWQNIMKGLRTDSDGLASSAEELSAVSNKLVNISEENLQQSITVTSTTEQVSANINKMAKDAEKASVNSDDVAKEMEHVSTSIKEMTNVVNEASVSLSTMANTAKQMSANMSVIVNSVKEIKTSTDHITNNADETYKVTEAMGKLVTAAKEIEGNVEQADAGAKRVAEYVDQIAKNSKGVVNNVLRVDISIEHVSKSINEIADSSKNIAHRAEIASKGTKLVSYNATDMNRSAQNSVQGAKQVSKNAHELVRIASDLKSVVAQFKI